MTRRPILALLLILATPAAAQSPSQTQRLPGHIPAWANAAHDAGPVPAARELSHLVLTLQRPADRAAAFQQLLADQQNTTSAAYHHWLTPQQIGATYGPDPADIAALTAWLTAQGLCVETVSPTGLSITFGGPAQSVARAFSTELHLFTLPDATTRYAPTTEPAIPTALAPHIANITGLAEETVTPQNIMQQGPISMIGRTPPHSAATPDYTLSGGTHWISPNDFATLYDLNPVYASGINGAGTRVAVLGSSNVAANDIAQYESLAALPRVLPNYIVVPGQGDPGITQTSAQGEATLDVDRVIGTAPGATVDLVTVASLADTNLLAALNYILSSTTDTVISMSFGSCEQNTTAGATRVQSFDTVFQQAAAQGVTVVVSSGDSGAAACDTHGQAAPAAQSLATNFLCASSYVTCVGGTEFIDTASPSAYWGTNGTGRASALSYIPEGAWNEPGSNFVVAATGGGASFNIAKPSYQTGTGVPADGHRDSPDLSFSASGHNAYFVCLAYAGADCISLIQGFAGTSASAPGFAGIVALANQTLGGPQGSINPLLYRLAASPTNNVFHDATIATSGVSSCTAAVPSLCNNSTPGPGSLTGGQAGYVLTTGYDQATGLGSLDVANFLLVASGGARTILTASANPITTAQTASITATLTGSSTTPTGTVQFVVDGTNSGSPINLNSGTATLPAATYIAGTHTVVAIYSGDGTYPGNRSTTLTLQVTGTTTPTVVLSIAPPIVAVGGSTTATVSIAGSPTASGTATLYRVGVAYQTQPLSGGTATFTLPGNNFGPGSYFFSATYSGDTNYQAATSNGAPLLVASIILQAAAPPTVASGTSTGSSVTVISNNFLGNVAMSCALTTTSFPTYPATCSITSPPAFTANGSAIVALTINSTTPHARTGTGAAAALTLAALGLLCFRRRRALPILATLLLCGVATLTGCGSGSSSSTPTGPVGSSAATYTVTLTAAGTGNVALTTTATTTVTIQ
jgi:subtilase family serine protease